MLDLALQVSKKPTFDAAVLNIDYTTPSAVPLPAALPLFGAGLAIMGFIGWRRKRKAA